MERRKIRINLQEGHGHLLGVSPFEPFKGFLFIAQLDVSFSHPVWIVICQVCRIASSLDLLAQNARPARNRICFLILLCDVSMSFASQTLIPEIQSLIVLTLQLVSIGNEVQRLPSRLARCPGSCPFQAFLFSTGGTNTVPWTTAS